MASFKIYFLLAVLLAALFDVCTARAYDMVDAPTAAPTKWRPKRDHGHRGVTGPVHTFVKTDKHANYKWGVRHHVGHKYAGS